MQLHNIRKEFGQKDPNEIRKLEDEEKQLLNDTEMIKELKAKYDLTAF